MYVNSMSSHNLNFYISENLFSQDAQQFGSFLSSTLEQIDAVKRRNDRVDKIRDTRRAETSMGFAQTPGQNFSRSARVQFA